VMLPQISISKQVRHGNMGIYKALKVANEDNNYDYSGLKCVLFVYYLTFGSLWKDI
jgi:hypothetical protein